MSVQEGPGQADQEVGWDKPATEGAPGDGGVQVGVGAGVTSGVVQGGSVVGVDGVVVGGVGGVVCGGVDGVVSGGVDGVVWGGVGGVVWGGVDTAVLVAVGAVVGGVFSDGVDGVLVGDRVFGGVHGGKVLVGGFAGSVGVVAEVGVLCVGAVVVGSGVLPSVVTGTWVGSSSLSALPSSPVGGGTTPSRSGSVTVELL